MKQIEQQLYHFLLNIFNNTKVDMGPLPVLIGCSGGADSVALVHLLHQFKQRFPINLHVAHVDHGWREESPQDAEYVRMLALRLDMSYHSIRLDSDAINGNREDYYREERRAYFADLCHSYGFHAVALGHHADDQAETVLKRLFEGASLTAIQAMIPVSSYDEVLVWRPLLPVRKKEIVAWLESKGIQHIKDSTNSDERYMRARMRHTLIPHLSNLFGKNITGNLCSLAHDAALLREEIEEELDYYRDRIFSTEEVRSIDLGSDMPRCSLVLSALIKEVCIGALLNREILTTVRRLLRKKAANKQILLAQSKIRIDRGSLSFWRKAPSLLLNMKP